jgi:hypothetical protein
MVLSSRMFHRVPVYIGVNVSVEHAISIFQGREGCGIQLQNVGTCVFRSFRGTYCLHSHIDSLQDVDAEMEGI